MSEWKQRAKVTFKKCYWQAVIVAFISFLVMGGIGSIVGNVNNVRQTVTQSYDQQSQEKFSLQREVENVTKDIFGEELVFLVVDSFIIGIILSLIFKLVVTYPILIGTNNYFMGIREKEKKLDSLLSVYKSGKLTNTAAIMFVMNIYIYLWSLLFIVPGIIKSYEYRMIPYILSENPDMPMDRAFELSRKMMYGNKWDTFLLDISFIGWYILSIFTLGLVSLFYVSPYVKSTNAELYAVLREEALHEGYADNSELLGFV